MSSASETIQQNLVDNYSLYLLLYSVYPLIGLKSFKINAKSLFPLNQLSLSVKNRLTLFRFIDVI